MNVMCVVELAGEPDIRFRKDGQSWHGLGRTQESEVAISLKIEALHLTQMKEAS
jgi:hypothetical protein